MAGLSDWPQSKAQRTGSGRRLLYQVTGAVAVFLMLMALKETGGAVGGWIQRGAQAVLTTEWNYQPVLQRVVRHGLQAVNVEAPFLGEVSQPAGAPAEGELLSLPVSGRVVRGFGWSKSDGSGLEHYHAGIDIKVPVGTPVKAAAAGEVVKIGVDPFLGSYILLQHKREKSTLYAQLGRIEVVLGQTVKAGTVIGKVGDKGDIEGGGLHFEYREAGRPVDPLSRITDFQGEATGQ